MSCEKVANAMLYIALATFFLSLETIERKNKHGFGQHLYS